MVMTTLDRRALSSSWIRVARFSAVGSSDKVRHSVLAAVVTFCWAGGPEMQKSHIPSHCAGASPKCLGQEHVVRQDPCPPLHPYL
jgi:hypothetical protein